MSECSILPVVAVLPIAASAASAAPIDAEIEGGFSPDTAFTVDEPPLEELTTDTVVADMPTVDTPPQDRLQMLIEDLSGITGVLREVAPAEPEAGVGTQKAPGTSRQDVRIGVPASAEPLLDAKVVVQADPEAIQSGVSLAATSLVDVLLADALPPATVGGKEGASAPMHSLPPKIPVVAISQQIAEAVVTAREDRVEVVLAPEELGRIRMVMSGPEHSPHVLIWAERPEVLDQLRRNASFLQECFGDAGMADASFEFQGDGSGGSEDRHSLPDEILQGFDMTESVSVPLAWTPLVIPARLDIRI